MKLSYTSASDFQVCKSRYFHKHVAKDAPFEMTPQMAWGDKVHKAFEARLGAGRSFPEELTDMEPFAQAVLASMHESNNLSLLVEHRLGVLADGTMCGFYNKDVFWNGKVDVAVHNDVTCLLLDWKTGKQREDPWELGIQAVLLAAAHPKLELFKGRYIWLKDGTVGAVHKLDTARTWAEMQALGTMVKRSAQTNHWPEQEGPLCRFCPVRQCRFNRSAPAAGNGSGLS